ncbi:MAG: hypothetical protein ACU833_06935 [Gammaproteobacteria bacterium]
MPAMIDAGFAASMALAAAGFALPWFVHDFKHDRLLTRCYWLVMILHQAVALANIYLFTVIGAGRDAMLFHFKAEQMSPIDPIQFFRMQYAVGSEFYIQLLGLLYSVFGPSMLLGHEFTLAAFALSCLALVKIAALFDLKRYRAAMLLCYGCLPSVLIFGSLMLRESFQTLFFMCAVLFWLKFLYQSHRIIDLAAALLSCLAMALFHKGLVIYAAFLVVLSVISVLQSAGRKNVLFFSVLALFITAAALISSEITFSGKGLNAARALLEGKGLDFVIEYREFSRDARTSYGIELETSSWSAIAASTVRIFIHYLFAPFPWQITHAKDVYASLESLFRLTLILSAVIAWSRAQGTMRKTYPTLILLYFSMAFLWSLGTTSYGTAIRHHTVHYWILLVLGLPFLTDSLSRLLQRASARISPK